MDPVALARLQERIAQSGLAGRIEAKHRSLFDNEFEDGSFDVLYEVDARRAILVPRGRVLRPIPSARPIDPAVEGVIQ